VIFEFEQLVASTGIEPVNAKSDNLRESLR